MVAMNSFLRDLRANPVVGKIARVFQILEVLGIVVVVLLVVLGILFVSRYEQSRKPEPEKTPSISRSTPIPPNRFA